MSKTFLKSLLVGPAALGAVVAVSGAAMAAESAPASEAVSVDALEEVTSLGAEPVELAQITNVSELTDVVPSDWAYQALANLVRQLRLYSGLSRPDFPWSA
jgi:hypothetical protein